MLSLADAWQWVQIGFCASLGASALAVVVASVFGGGRQQEQEYPEPHCSRCCPNDDFEEP